jgi:hypothetical protein
VDATHRATLGFRALVAAIAATFINNPGLGRVRSERAHSQRSLVVDRDFVRSEQLERVLMMTIDELTYAVQTDWGAQRLLLAKAM